MLIWKKREKIQMEVEFLGERTAAQEMPKSLPTTSMQFRPVQVKLV